MLPSTEISDRASAIIAAGDRRAALALLADLASSVEATGASSSLPDPLGEAVLATALGALTEQHRQAAIAYECSRLKLHDIIDSIGSEPFTAEDLQVIRTALDERLRRLHDQDNHERAARAAHNRSGSADGELTPAASAERARLGPGRYLELKRIPDRRSGKLYGPYLYLRWLEANRFRSRYIGKPPS